MVRQKIDCAFARFVYDTQICLAERAYGERSQDMRHFEYDTNSKEITSTGSNKRYVLGHYRRL